MATSTYRRSSFHLDLCFEKAAGDLAAQDRQCAWELYTELVTRGAVCGSVNTKGEPLFRDEFLIPVFASLREFLTEARGLMRRYPVGKLSLDCPHHLGSLIGGMLQVSVQPFLAQWDASYCEWWSEQNAKGTAPMAQHNRYPQVGLLGIAPLFRTQETG